MPIAAVLVPNLLQSHCSTCLRPAIAGNWFWWKQQNFWQFIAAQIGEKRREKERTIRKEIRILKGWLATPVQMSSSAQPAAVTRWKKWELGKPPKDICLTSVPLAKQAASSFHGPECRSLFPHFGSLDPALRFSTLISQMTNQNPRLKKTPFEVGFLGSSPSILSAGFKSWRQDCSKVTFLSSSVRSSFRYDVPCRKVIININSGQP